MKNPSEEPNTKQDIVGNRHSDTVGINFYIKLCSPSVPLATFIYPFFSSYILLEDWKRIAAHLLLCFIALHLLTAVAIVARMCAMAG